MEYRYEERDLLFEEKSLIYLKINVFGETAKKNLRILDINTLVKFIAVLNEIKEM